MIVRKPCATPYITSVASLKALETSSSEKSTEKPDAYSQAPSKAKGIFGLLRNLLLRKETKP